MSNEEIVSLLELTVKLLELHDENEFKIKNLGFATRALDKTTEDLLNLSVEQLAGLPSVGKSIAGKIDEIRRTGTTQELTELLSRTPEGVLEMLQIKGIGPKKVRTIWQELGITDNRELLLACENGEVAKLKGFGDKIQATIKESILYAQSNTGKLRMEKGEELAQILFDELEKQFEQVEIVGDVRRKNEIVNSIQLVVGHTKPWEVQQFLNALNYLQQDEKISSPFAWRGKFQEKEIPVEIQVCSPQQFVNQVFIYSSSEKHLATNGIYKRVNQQIFDSEEAIYESLNIPYIIPEMREGRFEFDWVQNHQNEELVTWDSLKGILHNHSTYSDGKHTLEAMADYCRELGFEYLGIADHSKTASYAKGLSEERIIEQHAEIEKLNQKYASMTDRPFKILKGIESDILGDGSLDYADDVLKSFDYIVASIHQNLKMTEEKAMSRIIKAIENPYTTILGHPTGRILLSRAGYPIDYQKVIDACAANGVVIEINASPYRLDLDWRWIQYALEKNVMLSINPDAHEKEGYFDMHYGVAVARKGGLTSKMTFNVLSLSEMEEYLKGKR
ncbi:DNA polymerase (family 10) [Arcicella aurantiaca]|uniref:DNA polymerase (Family 10) n=1 Tax=Arcicella aurantiaca TaxID=591202 RepID=A0A316E7V1_9BACT|nr:DNA polymerase/3'-5' exonuclease PolX [Arcicella aurantiaca]PWK26791.1 DNA polymerase (family 10) [Arcicella aurantiaca]